MNIVERIEEIINANIPDAYVLVHNTNDDNEHFEAVVISKTFDQKSLLQQHQAVMKPLKEAFDQMVHALALKTFSQKKWLETRDHHPLISKKIKEKYHDFQ